jgi:hypothetical protein
VDVLRHVFVEFFQLFAVDFAAAAARDLAVLDAAELVVLLPEIRLEDLGGSEEAEDRDVARGERVFAFQREGGRRASERAEARRSPGRGSRRQERSTTQTSIRGLADAALAPPPSFIVGCLVWSSMVYLPFGGVVMKRYSPLDADRGRSFRRSKIFTIGELA